MTNWLANYSIMVLKVGGISFTTTVIIKRIINFFFAINFRKKLYFAAAVMKTINMLLMILRKYPPVLAGLYYLNVVSEYFMHIMRIQKESNAFIC